MRLSINRLLNKLQPGIIPEGSFKESNIAYKQMENISAYTKGCLVLGLSPSDVFHTVDLFEAKNLNLVCNQLTYITTYTVLTPTSTYTSPCNIRS